MNERFVIVKAHNRARGDQLYFIRDRKNDCFIPERSGLGMYWSDAKNLRNMLRAEEEVNTILPEIQNDA